MGVVAGSRLAKPPRSGARRGGLEAVATSWTIECQEDAEQRAEQASAPASRSSAGAPVTDSATGP
jgi:hypothetical protein